MGMHIVIDGYNLICCSRQFDDTCRGDLQAGREALVDFLADYKRLKPYKITVVFDGGAAAVGLPRRDRLKGIDLRYSNPGELADTVIKRMAAREKEKLLVVSSDNEIVRYAQSKGATAISSSEFEDRVLWAQYEQAKGIGAEATVDEAWQPTTKKKGPSRRLSKRRRKVNQKLKKL